MPRDFLSGRHAGVLVPLFAIPTRASWGIGELADLPSFAQWMRDAGLDFVQLLPLNEMSDGQNSPYSPMSAMAIDPIFIAPGAMPDVDALGGEAMLRAPEREALNEARRAPGVAYGTIRPLKRTVLKMAFDRFVTEEHERATERAAGFEAFRARERWWLDEYTLFRALHAREESRHWLEWPAPLGGRDPAALQTARCELAREILFYAYLQWVADEQWREARAAAVNVGVFGDFPFMVSGDSADVWSRQGDFRIDASVGVPPDAFSETGQDWGFPAYRWSEIAAGGDEWLAMRARRSADLYDGYRVDHLVGFYRTFVRERDGRSAFDPPDEPSQIAQGERLLRLFSSTRARIIAEDLGLVPDFVRSSLARLQVPGYRVLRWEREWHLPGQPFRDPATFPPLSVATTATHDTETLAEWWDTATPDERAGLASLPLLRDRGCAAGEPFGDRIRDAFLEALFASGADFVIVPIQDLFGWRDRINTPATISDTNWTWRLPWFVDDMDVEPTASERGAFTRKLGQTYRRF
jgi:4-alpha-glucanotransferase